MGTETILITGAAGEIGHSLVALFNRLGERVVAVDIHQPHNLPDGVEFQKLDITDTAGVQELFRARSFSQVFHLAGILSTGGEKNPLLAHEVNVQGSFNLLTATHELAKRTNAHTRFVFPSTIAAYGISSVDIKNASPLVREDQFLTPITMYGNNKLYVENMGRYFSTHFQFLNSETHPHLDFRCLRLPGIISADTVPTGGTSDYGPEMLHAAAQGKHYDCFVTPDAKLPFMAMPDAVRALIGIADAPREALTQSVYNVRAFSLSAEEIRQRVLSLFPGASIGYALHEKRNAIVASWPADTDDSAARRDWGWSPSYDADKAFAEYLAPAIRARYAPKNKRSGPDLGCVAL